MSQLAVGLKDKLYFYYCFGKSNPVMIPKHTPGLFSAAARAS